VALALSRTWTVYTSAIPLLRNGTINVEGHSFKAVLLNGSYDPSAGVDSQRTDVAAYAIGVDQTVSPLTLSGDSVSTTSTVSWDGSYSPRYVAIYDDSSPSDYLLCVADMGGVQGPCSYRLDSQDLFSLSGITSGVESVVPTTASLIFTGYQPGIDTGSGITAHFSDGFETGNFSHTENTFSWGFSDATVETTVKRTGSYSAEFLYPGTASGSYTNTELFFDVTNSAGTAPSEVWFEWYHYVPTNFTMRSDGYNWNNKLFAIWAEDYSTSGDVQMVFEFAGSGSTTEVRALMMTGTGDAANVAAYKTGSPVFTTAMAGTWVRMRIHLKVGTAAGNFDGVAELWRDEELIYRATDLDWYYTGGANYLRQGYLMGNANTGYDNDTYFYIDDFKVYTTDPGWNVVPLFADSFETGDLSLSYNGVSWSAPNDTSVVASNARTGTSALQFYFQGVPTGTDWSAEQRWSMPQTTEVWVEYYLKVPSNYVHRDEPDTQHHKLWAIWGYDYALSGRPKVVAEWWRTSDSISYWRFLYNPSGSGTSQQLEVGTQAVGVPANSWDMPLGDYSQVRIHADMGTPDVANGVYQVWINGVQILNRSDLLMIDSVDPYQYFSAGYLMGYTNGGYDNDTYFYVDDFKIYTTNPNW